MEERNFEQEVQELYEAAPDMKGRELPQEVVDACMTGKTVVQAYSDYKKDLQKAETVKKQNEKAAARAPVRGVSTGGSTGAQPEDAFLRGFNTAW